MQLDKVIEDDVSSVSLRPAKLDGGNRLLPVEVGEDDTSMRPRCLTSKGYRKVWMWANSVRSVHSVDTELSGWLCSSDAWLFNQGVLSCSAESPVTPRCLDADERSVDLLSRDLSRGQRWSDGIL